MTDNKKSITFHILDDLDGDVDMATESSASTAASEAPEKRINTRSVTKDNLPIGWFIP